MFVNFLIVLVTAYYLQLKIIFLSFIIFYCLLYMFFRRKNEYRKRMGTINTREKKESDVVSCLRHLMTAELPPSTDETLQELLATCHSLLCDGSGWFVIEESIASDLLRDNIRTQRLPWLLNFSARCLVHYYQSIQSGTSGTATEHDVCVVEAVVFFMEKLLRHVFRLSRDCFTILNAQLKAHGETVKQFVNAVLLVCVKDSSSSGTGMPEHPRLLRLHAGLMHLLLTLNASAVYHHAAQNNDTDIIEDVFTQYLLASPLLDGLLSVLLHRLLYWRDLARFPGSSNPTDETSDGGVFSHEPSASSSSSLFSGLFNGLFRGGGRNSLGMSRSSVTEAAEKLLMPWCAVTLRESCQWSMLRCSAILLSLLPTYGRGSPQRLHGVAELLDGRNPARVYISRLQPQPLRADAGGVRGLGLTPTTAMLSASRSSAPASALHQASAAAVGDDAVEVVSPVDLLEALAVCVPACPALFMVLYTLVMDNPSLLHEAIVESSSSTHTGLGGSGDICRGSRAILQILYQLLDMSFSINAHRFSSALEQRGWQQYNSSSAQGTATLATAHSVRSTGDDSRPVSPETLLHMVSHEAVPLAYPHLELMISTMLFLFSQDRVVNREMCDRTLAHISLPASGTAGGPGVGGGNHSGGILSSAVYQRQSMTLGALAVTVLCLGMSQAVRDLNAPLASMYAVTLANLSPFIKDMDSSSAQRLVRTTVVLLRILDKPVGSVAPEGGNTTGCREKNSDVGGELSASFSSSFFPCCFSLPAAEISLQVLRVLVEAIEGMLVGKRRGSEHLIYELLYSKEQLTLRNSDEGGNDEEDALHRDGGDSRAKEEISGGASPTRAVTDASKMKNVACPVSQDEVKAALLERREDILSETRLVLRHIEAITQSYYADIAAQGLDRSAEEIIEVIRKGNREGGAGGGDRAGSSGIPAEMRDQQRYSPRSTARKEWLLYVYEESPSSELFFYPFLWSCVYASAGHPGSPLLALQASECSMFTS